MRARKKKKKRIIKIEKKGHEGNNIKINQLLFIFMKSMICE